MTVWLSDDTPALRALSRVAAHLVRYSCAGPIPLAFSVALGGHDITIRCVATIPDVEVYRATGQLKSRTVTHRGGVAYDADEALIADQVAMLTRVAYEHERCEWLCFDGAPMVDPHRGPGGRKVSERL